MASLPHDVLFEISSWLPAKAIYKFSSTSKFFSNFPRDKYFALKQTQNSLSKIDTCLFFQPDLTQRYNNNIAELHHLSGEDHSSGVSKVFINFLANSAKILSSSNGLILFRSTSDNKDQLFISNPATQTLLPIPIPDQLYTSVDADLKVVLQCDGQDNCMVFLFHDKEEDWCSNLECKVYATKEGVWKKKEGSFFTGSRNLKFDMPVIHNGVVHYISDCFPYFTKDSPYYRPYIMAYNFENGITTMLNVPKEARRGLHDISCDMRIFKWGKVNSSMDQSICLVRLRKCVFTIWVLTKYESSVWKKILKLRVKALGLIEKDPMVKGFSVMNGDLLVFATNKKVYGYGLSFSNENYMRIEEICEHGCDGSMVSFTSYSNTLRPCGGDDAKALLLTSTSFNEEL
ncbi:F-box protein At5g49610-like [Cicer arietinum]|uniref:Uncharacterized protein LOC101488718 n=1 Tax=Cicer arietinum TaxID=3827 RepID=A0A1S2XS58_CICAR|nr:uncharacterized protein LOC101488718 [Cicer arietinum]